MPPEEASVSDAAGKGRTVEEAMEEDDDEEDMAEEEEEDDDVVDDDDDEKVATGDNGDPSTEESRVKREESEDFLST